MTNRMISSVKERNATETVSILQHFERAALFDAL
jgi:hypothetical protein